jgi:hypothetical protein
MQHKQSVKPLITPISQQRDQSISIIPSDQKVSPVIQYEGETHASALWWANCGKFIRIQNPNIKT